MKVRSSLKLICKYCKFEKKKGILRVNCLLTGRHNQKKGFSTSNKPEIDHTSCSCCKTFNFNELLNTVFSLDLKDKLNNLI